MRFTGPAPGGGGGGDPLDKQHLEALLMNERRDKAHVIADLDKVIDALCVLLPTLEDICTIETYYRDKAREGTGHGVVLAASVAGNLGAALMDYLHVRQALHDAELTLTNLDKTPKSAAQLRADIDKIRQGRTTWL